MPLVHKTITKAALAIGFGLLATSAYAQSPGAPFADDQDPAVTDETLDADDLGGAATGAGAGDGITGIPGPSLPGPGQSYGNINDSPDTTPLSPAESGGPYPGGGTGGGSR